MPSVEGLELRYGGYLALADCPAPFPRRDRERAGRDAKDEWPARL